METISAIESRRAVKHYDLNHEMPGDIEKKILSLAMQSPTAFNIQNWRFVVVKDKTLREKIRAVSWDQAQVTDASELLVLCFDTQTWNREPARYWRNAPQEVQDFLLPALDTYYRDKPQITRDEGMRSCGIAGQTIMLMAGELGYDSCPMDGFNYATVAEIIELPEDCEIAFMIAIGKATKQAWPRPGQLPLEEVMVENHF